MYTQGHLETSKFSTGWWEEAEHPTNLPLIGLRVGIKKNVNPENNKPPFAVSAVAVVFRSIFCNLKGSYNNLHLIFDSHL